MTMAIAKVTRMGKTYKVLLRRSPKIYVMQFPMFIEDLAKCMQPHLSLARSTPKQKNSSRLLLLFQCAVTDVLLHTPKAQRAMAPQKLKLQKRWASLFQ